jgi:dipeptidyl-peptidase-4
MAVSAEPLRVTDAERLVDFQQRPIHRWVVEAEPVSQQMLPAGTILIPVQQRLGRLAAYLLEPDSDDSLARWGFFQGLMEVGQPYPVLRVMTAVSLEGLERLERVPSGERLTIEKLFDPARQIALAGERWPLPRWLPDRSAYVVERSGDAWPLVVEAASGAQQTLGVPARMARALAALEAFSQAEAREAVRSLDRFDAAFRWGLVTHRQQLFFYDDQAQSATALTESLAGEPQLAELSPDGSHVAYVLDHDLYVVATSDGTPLRLTHDGSPDRLSGILDWVYQEEIYGRGNFKGFWWSPDSRQLAWLQLDQTPVDRFSVTDSIPNLQAVEVTRYPKSGQPLPTAKLMMAHLDAPQDLRSVALEGYSPDDLLIVRVDWHPEQPWLTVQLQNRAQTWLDLLKVVSADRPAERLWREAGRAWVDRLEAPHWLADGSFLWLSDLPEGWRRLVRIDPATQQRQVLTQGDWEVSSLVAVSPDERFAWVVGNPGSLIESHVVRVELSSGHWQKLTVASGMHQPAVSADGDYFLDLHSALDRPPQIDLCDASGERVRVVAIGTNDRHKALQVSPPRLFTIPADDGQPLQSLLMLPPGFDPETASMAERLPVVMYVYGGPAAPTVKQAWGERNYWWHQFLAQQGYAVLLCDNRSARGTHRGQTWQIHRDLGRVELADVEAAAGWLQSQPWVDTDRIGIWGWSYGGYLTALVMTHSDRFRAGIAGAPVTDWHLYDAIYTERYMGLPQDNPEGYLRSSVLRAADRLAGGLLLVHGEQDDNVHMQNSLQLAHALQQADRPFEMMVYPRNRHAVTDPRQRLHLHRLMFNFWERQLAAVKP